MTIKNAKLAFSGVSIYSVHVRKSPWVPVIGNGELVYVSMTSGCDSSPQVDAYIWFNINSVDQLFIDHSKSLEKKL